MRNISCFIRHRYHTFSTSFSALSETAGIPLSMLCFSHGFLMAWQVLSTMGITGISFIGVPFIFYAFMQLLILLLLTPFPIGIQKKVLFLWVVSQWAIFYPNAFTILVYHVFLNHTFFPVITGTSLQEALEFISIHFGSFSISFLIFLFAIIVSRKAALRWDLFRPEKIRRMAKSFSPAFVLLLALLMPHAFLYVPSVCFLDGLFHSAIFSAADRTDVSLDEKLKGFSAPYAEDFPDTVAIVIGESMNRNHMGLYGYSRDTTPFLKKLLEEGSLAVFTDAVSPHQLTYQSLQEALTWHHGDSSHPFQDYATLPEVFHTAGFRTLWLSNQECNRISGVDPYFMGKCDYSYCTMEHAQTNNDFSHQYDDTLFPALSQQMAIQEGRSAYFIHLMGCHTIYNRRYPKEFQFGEYSPLEEAMYSASSPFGDVLWPHMGLAQMHLVDDYDSAVMYQDKVLYELFRKFDGMDALVFFFSDHGELVYDDNITDTYSHGQTFANRNLYEIPLMVYATDEFRRIHPGLWEKIQKARQRAFSIGFFSDSVAGLFRIRLLANEYQRILFSDSYNTSPRECDGVCYDSLLKAKTDSIPIRR